MDNRQLRECDWYVPQEVKDARRLQALFDVVQDVPKEYFHFKYQYREMIAFKAIEIVLERLFEAVEKLKDKEISKEDFDAIHRETMRICRLAKEEMDTHYFAWELGDED